jgi:hypothetical protein
MGKQNIAVAEAYRRDYSPHGGWKHRKKELVIRENFKDTFLARLCFLMFPDPSKLEPPARDQGLSTRASGVCPQLPKWNIQPIM